jgi:protein-tyrosine phosphatase
MDDSNLSRLRRMAPDREAAERTAMFRSFDPALAGRGDGSDQEVPDPYGGGPEEYALVFDLVLPAARGLADQLRQMLADRSPAPGPPD